MDFSSAKVILSREHFILSKSNGTLWCDRRDGRLTAGTILQRDSASDYIDLGSIWGIVGKLNFFTDGDSKLVVITQASLAGTLPQGGDVYCIDKIGILPLSANFDFQADIIGFEVPEQSETGQYLSRPPSPASLGGSKPPRRNVQSVPDKEKSKEVREREKVEKRLTEALLSMFNESQSFYFCKDFDLTRSFQRQLDASGGNLEESLSWKKVDERFFWNRWMIRELLDDESNAPGLASEWVLPVIQGYVEVRRIPVRSHDAPDILQPGWSKHYREERERIIKETIAEGEAQKRSKRGSKEMELRDMSAILSPDHLSIPMKTMSSSGFDYDSGSDNPSEEEAAEFSPVTFTDSMTQGRTVPGVRQPTPVTPSTEGKPRADADADVLRNGGTRVAEDGNLTTIGGPDSGECEVKVEEDEAGGEDSKEEGEEKTWCVLEKEEDVIRTRVFSDADVLNGVGGGTRRPEGKNESSPDERKGEDGCKSTDVVDGGVVEEVIAGNTVCNENGERESSSSATGKKDVNVDAEVATSTMDASSGTPPPGEVPSLNHSGLQGEGDLMVEEVTGDHSDGMVQKVKVESSPPIVTPGDGSQSDVAPGEAANVPLTKEGKDECDIENRAGEDGSTIAGGGFDDEKKVMQNDREKNMEVNGHDDSQCGRLVSCNGDGGSSGSSTSNKSDSPSAMSDVVAEGQVSNHLERGSNVLSSPTRYTAPEVDVVIAAASIGEVSGNLKRSSDVMLSPTRYYATTDAPEVGGVVVDLLDDEQAGKLVESLQLSGNQSVRTHGEVSPQLVVDEFPESLSRGSPMGNPFLGQQSSPSWSRHERARSKERELQREEEEYPTFTMAIISRRSCHRAGTRYRRRGVDSDGHVANYVETELLVKCGSHVVSYVIVRGSVPVYWSQPGYKYRPQPVIERGVEDTQKAFCKHFEQQLSLFKEMVVVNLVKQSGREKLVGDAFEQHILLLDNPQLTYMTFDFHQSYKVNQTVAMQRLRTSALEFVKRFKFCWQEGVFRVNCMDCLDRTNVVESLFSKELLQMALQKLGVLPFEDTLGGSTLVSYQEMWANNGDIVSKQYAGTAAMKGDITRYGERKISGMMKDGYNSAHRYYINIFRDSYRQVLIDLMQGVNPSEAFFSLPRSLQGMDELDDSSSLVVTSVSTHAQAAQAWSLEREEEVADMLSYCESELFPSMDSASLHSWILMEPAGMSFVTDNKEDEPCVVIYCRGRAQLCVAKCDMEAKKIICFLRIPIFQVQRITIGQLGVFRNNKRLHMRLHYSLIEGSSVYFTFTTLNHMSPNEERVILTSIAEFLANFQPRITVQDQKINKKRSHTHQGVVFLVPPVGTVDAVLASSAAVATPMDSITSTQSSIPSPASEETEEREASPISSELISVKDDDKEASLSAPSSPPSVRRSLHRRQRSQSLDAIAINGPGLSSEFTSVQPSITIDGLPMEEDRDASLGYDITDGGLDSSDSDSDSDDFDEQEKRRAAASLQSNIPPGDLKESEEESEEGGGKLSQLKGMFLSRVKSSKNNVMPRPHSQSPQTAETINAESKDAGNNLPAETEGDGRTSGSSQWVGAMKQRLRMNSPGLWRKMRKISPSNQTVLAGEDLDLAKLEEARRKCKSRIIAI